MLTVSSSSQPAPRAFNRLAPGTFIDLTDQANLRNARSLKDGHFVEALEHSSLKIAISAIGSPAQVRARCP